MEAPHCTVCHLPKKPIGRSTPMEMAGSLCDDSCIGYHADPVPKQLWPGEECPMCHGDGILQTKPAGAGYEDDLPEYEPCWMCR